MGHKTGPVHRETQWPFFSAIYPRDKFLSLQATVILGHLPAPFPNSYPPVRWCHQPEASQVPTSYPSSSFSHSCRFLVAGVG